MVLVTRNANGSPPHAGPSTARAEDPLRGSPLPRTTPSGSLRAEADATSASERARSPAVQLLPPARSTSVVGAPGGWDATLPRARDRSPAAPPTHAPPQWTRRDPDTARKPRALPRAHGLPHPAERRATRSPAQRVDPA